MANGNSIIINQPVFPIHLVLCSGPFADLCVRMPRSLGAIPLSVRASARGRYSGLSFFWRPLAPPLPPTPPAEWRPSSLLSFLPDPSREGEEGRLLLVTQ